MKAYKCDCCNLFFTGYPYDNLVLKLELCDNCAEIISQISIDLRKGYQKWLAKEIDKFGRAAIAGTNLTTILTNFYEDDIEKFTEYFGTRSVELLEAAQKLM